MPEFDVEKPECGMCGHVGYVGAWCINCDHYFEACVCKPPKPEFFEILFICPECDAKW